MVKLAVDLNAPMSSWAADTARNKRYMHLKPSGRHEDWGEVATRVAESVVRPYLPAWVEPIRRAIERREFMPGGRYLYACGRQYQQVNNCLAGETKVVTREGVRRLRDLVGESFEVLNRFGEWEAATARAFGVQRLYRIKFTNRDEVLATANHRWWQRHGRRITTADLQEVPLTLPQEFPNLDEEGIRHGIVFGDGCLPTGSKHSHFRPVKHKECLVDYFTNEQRIVNVGYGGKLTLETVRTAQGGRRHVALQPSHYKTLPDCETCSPEYARGFIAGLIATDGSTKTSTVTISNKSRETIEAIRDLAVLGGCVVTGFHEARPKKNYINTTGQPVYVLGIKPFSAPLIRPDQIAELGERRLRHTKMWLDVEHIEDTGREETVYCCVVPGTESFTLSNGLMTSNCFLFRAEDSREGWGDLGYKSRLCLMTGGGIGCDYSALREYGRLVTKMGGEASGPCALMQMTNEEGRYIRQGGSRRSAIWAGLLWNHKDIKRFCKLKDWPAEVRALKEKDFNFPAPMDGTNISVILDDDFFEAYEDSTNPQHALAHDVYWTVVKRMLKTGEPGFSVNVGEKRRESLRNACTEVSSEDDGDMCNLGSINMARVASMERFVELVELGMVFLLCGTLMSQLPIQSMYKIREKNRRLGLGLMGIHEWLLRRGKLYGPDSELAEWLVTYRMSGAFANRWCDKLSISRSVATRAIAPNGTIGIVAETTGSGEPMFAAAYQRRYLNGEQWEYQNVLDPVARRLVEDDGIDPDGIEDAYILAEDYERRIAFQGWLQQFVDMSISSTINLPSWGSSINNEGTVRKFGDTLYRYLPTVRGITAYPDGARGGQPLVRLRYTEAVKRGVGIVFREQYTRPPVAVSLVGNGETHREIGPLEKAVNDAYDRADKETLVDTFLQEASGEPQETEQERVCRLANGGCSTGTCGE